MHAPAPLVDAPTLEHYLVVSARSPIALRLILGHLLRTLRKAARIEAEAAGKSIRGSEAKISRMERAQVTCKHDDVMDLLTLYGIDDKHVRACFTEIVRISRQPGWWHRFDGILPDWCGKLIGLQEAASVIRTYEVQLVPGLLQTPDYTEALVRQAYPAAAPEEVRDRLELRALRQNILTREDAPRLWVVLDEAVLRRPMGGEPIMREQLRHLIHMSRLDHVTIQIAPFNRPGCIAGGFPITHLRFDVPALPDVVYLEQLQDAEYLDKPDETQHYRSVLDGLAQAALSPQESLDLLDHVLN
ncbi:helix-turn-helix transcriptional regulator [Streptomyces sp. CL12-4]|uniref:helix-turn-helix domain-containing protein n=1 Tax=Streptomyces sp. CL12-4 TaxID=2810306 RepID=UPI001EFBAE68|nr:helix-turn-helix transcriptional regulator [Streptomyces sp. CL12-4]MCG8971334.1 helix-turn-helix domain-containing protein [Streptomyces sp. CL12-4]